MNYLNALRPYVNPLLTVVVPVTTPKLKVALRMARLGYSNERISEFMASHHSLEVEQDHTEALKMLAPCASLSLPFKKNPDIKHTLTSAT